MTPRQEYFQWRRQAHLPHRSMSHRL
jgi:hypothetical protein